MMARLIARGVAAGEARAEAVRGALGEELAREVPGVTVSVVGEDVVVAGRGVLRRAEPALRWIAGVLR